MELLLACIHMAGNHFTLDSGKAMALVAPPVAWHIALYNLHLHHPAEGNQLSQIQSTSASWINANRASIG